MIQAVILDTETTGLVEPALVEAAWIAVDSPQGLLICDEFSGRFNPGKPITFGAMATHHITNEDVASCPPPSEFSLPDGVQYIVGHNVDFDWRLIGEPKVKRICTLAFCRKLWPDDSHTLGAMLYRLKGPMARDALRAVHSARADAYICRMILSEILSKIGEPATWEELWTLCEAARIPEIMAFGKHKGARIADIPADYKQWLLRQPDVDPYLQIALKGKRA